MKNFVSGLFVGSVATMAAIAGTIVAAKKIIIDPIEEKEAMIEENRKKAMRKRITR
ncbi:DUF3042 domain-containing protein [Enterococcus sp. JM4C]|uniref:DUF3042 family protein n=1 Tax=Candidatus Enterococcus huntleyi TaxID=1857217 RepID=UPI001379E80E|nr:DUF3042 family protein [Enterococcus sp. JM4C]KAF1296787.1 DUF3042 domain-containing protein [Enterococcus sp. JM4C]